MIWKILYGLVALSNGITFAAVSIFDFVPSPHAIACAAFFGASMGGIAMFNQD